MAKRYYKPYLWAWLFMVFFQWKTIQQQKQHIVIQSLPFSKMWLQIALSSLLGLLFGLSLKWWTQASLPLLDAQLAAMSLLATYWTSRKYFATWVLWIVVDLVYIGMFIYKELLLTAVLYAGFVVLAYLGGTNGIKSANNIQYILRCDGV